MDGACPFTFGRGVELGTVSGYLWLIGGVEDVVILPVVEGGNVMLPLVEGWSKGRCPITCGRGVE